MVRFETPVAGPPFGLASLAAGWTLLGLVAFLAVACNFDDSALGDKAECVANEECGGDQLCINGICVADISCIRNEDCQPGFQCVNASCVPAPGDMDFEVRDVAAPDLQPQDVVEDRRAEPDVVVRDPPVDRADAFDAPVDVPADVVDGDAPGDVVADADAPADVVDVADAVDAAFDVADVADVADAVDAAFDVADVADAVDAVDAPVDVVDAVDVPVDVADVLDVADVPDADAPVDAADADVADAVDLADEDAGIPEVATYEALLALGPQPEGTRVFVVDPGVEFTYSEAFGRWLFSWFYAMDPEVDNEIEGDVTPANETIPWDQLAVGGGTITASGGVVTMDASGSTGARARAFWEHPHTDSNHWASGVFGLTGSIGDGYLRHIVDVRDGVDGRAVVINLQNVVGDVDNGIRIVGLDDTPLGSSFDTVSTATPRYVDVFLYWEDRVDLYVDHVLLQTVPYAELPSSDWPVYRVGNPVTSGGGIVTVREAVFGVFTP